jgi:hypothetical protein
VKTRITPCLKCKADKAKEQYYVNEAELRDDLSFELECPLGHKTRLIFEAQKFEILFDVGASALMDGYCREAVSSFAVAQERFHEFCIKVFLESFPVKMESFRGTWKLVSNQSERQLGAYCFLHLLHFNAPPPIEPKMVELRNNVTHKGSIPSTEVAMTYADYVYGYIIDAIKLMRERLGSAINAVCKRDLEELRASVPIDVLSRSAAVPTMIWLSAPEGKFGKRSFNEAFARQKVDHVLELQQRIEDLEQQEDDDGNDGE